MDLHLKLLKAYSLISYKEIWWFIVSKDEESGQPVPVSDHHDRIKSFYV